MTAHTLQIRVRLVLVTLIALALLLAVGLWHSMSGENLRLLHPAMEDLPDEAAATRGQMVDVEVALKRPLFWQPRVPVPGAQTTAVVSEKVSAKLDGFKLLGIIIEQNKSIALLSTPEGIKRGALGAEVQGWKIEKVTSTGVTLSSAGQRAELTLAPPRHPGIHLDAR